MCLHLYIDMLDGQLGGHRNISNCFYTCFLTFYLFIYLSFYHCFYSCFFTFYLFIYLFIYNFKTRIEVSIYRPIRLNLYQFTDILRFGGVGCFEYFPLLFVVDIILTRRDAPWSFDQGQPARRRRHGRRGRVRVRRTRVVGSQRSLTIARSLVSVMVTVGRAVAVVAAVLELVDDVVQVPAFPVRPVNWTEM